MPPACACSCSCEQPVLRALVQLCARSRQLPRRPLDWPRAERRSGRLSVPARLCGAARFYEATRGDCPALVASLSLSVARLGRRTRTAPPTTVRGSSANNARRLAEKPPECDTGHRLASACPRPSREAKADGFLRSLISDVYSSAVSLRVFVWLFVWRAYQLGSRVASSPNGPKRKRRQLERIMRRRRQETAAGLTTTRRRVLAQTGCQESARRNNAPPGSLVLPRLSARSWFRLSLAAKMGKRLRAAFWRPALAGSLSRG